MSWSRRLTLAAGVFALSTVVLLAVTFASTPSEPRMEILPPLNPRAEGPVDPVPGGPLSVTQLDATIPADPTVPGGRPVRAWILRPSTPFRSGYPGVVLVHGAGPAGRDSLLTEARTLASAGVAAIVYDKRTRGYSAVRRDYDVLAEDAVRAAAVLAAAPDVDPRSIGVMGWSEGGWVAPSAVQRAPGRFAFLVLASAPIVSPAQQTVWLIRRAAPSAPGWLDRLTAMLLSSGSRLINYLDHDSRPALAGVRVPVLGVWGAEDTGVPVNQAVRAVVHQVPVRVSISVVPTAGHHLPVESGYLDRAAQWMRSAPVPGAPVHDDVRGVEPASAVAVLVLPQPAWFLHPLVQVAFSLGLVAAFLAGSSRAWTSRSPGVLA